MAIPKFQVDMEIISKLGDYPGSDNGLTPASFRRQFDLAGIFLKEYINDILLPNLDQLVDVEALLNGILDATLTQADKAAPAKLVGDRINQIQMNANINQALFFQKTIKSGNYVLGTDQAFEAYVVSANEIRVYGGEAVVQGHLIPLNINGYGTVNVSSGLYGTYRNDLICIRYERDENGSENKQLVVIEGQANQTVGFDPKYESNDINVPGTVVCDYPLYRVKLTGVDITLEKMYEVQTNLVDSVISQLNKWEGGSY